MYFIHTQTTTAAAVIKAISLLDNTVKGLDKKLATKWHSCGIIWRKRRRIQDLKTD